MRGPTVVLVGAEYEENLALRYLAASVAKAGFAAEIVPFNTAGYLDNAVGPSAIIHDLTALVSPRYRAFPWNILVLTRLRSQRNKST